MVTGIDTEIMRCATKGQISSMIVAHYTPFLKYLARSCKDADDVIQEIWTRAWRYWAPICLLVLEGREPSKILGAIFKKIFRQVVYKSKRNDENVNQGRDHVEITEVPENELQHNSRKKLQNDSRYYEIADKWVLASALMQLTDRHISVIKLALYEDRPYGEIKRELNLPTEQACRKLLHEARKQFYREVVKQCDALLSSFDNVSPDIVHIMKDVKRRASAALLRKKVKTE